MQELTRGPQEDRLLRATVLEQGHRNWSEVAQHIPGRTGKSCRLRSVYTLLQLYNLVEARNYHLPFACKIPKAGSLSLQVARPFGPWPQTGAFFEGGRSECDPGGRTAWSGPLGRNRKTAAGEVCSPAGTQTSLFFGSSPLGILLVPSVFFKCL